MGINQLTQQINKDHAIYSDAPMRLGRILLQKGIIGQDILNKAIITKRNEDFSVGSNGISRRSLAQILVNDFNMEYDLIYKEVAELYAFNTFEVYDEQESEEEENIEKLKNIINSFDGEKKTDARK